MNMATASEMFRRSAPLRSVALFLLGCAGLTLGKGCHMTRTKIAFLVAGAFALTLTVKEANSASFNATGALKESAVGANVVQKVYGFILTAGGGGTTPGMARTT